MQASGRRLSRVVTFGALALIVAIGACTESPSGPDRPVDATVVLAPGQTHVVPASTLRITFVEVLGDSRCPADALCILGGDAIVLIDISDGATSQRLDLHTGDNRPVTHGRFTIALVELSPYPFSGRPIDPRDYRARLRITG